MSGVDGLGSQAHVRADPNAYVSNALPKALARKLANEILEMDPWFYEKGRVVFELFEHLTEFAQQNEGVLLADALCFRMQASFDYAAMEGSPYDCVHHVLSEKHGWPLSWRKAAIQTLETGVNHYENVRAEIDNAALLRDALLSEHLGDHVSAPTQVMFTNAALEALELFTELALQSVMPAAPRAMSMWSDNHDAHLIAKGRMQAFEEDGKDFATNPWVMGTTAGAVVTSQVIPLRIAWQLFKANLWTWLQTGFGSKAVVSWTLSGAKMLASGLVANRGVHELARAHELRMQIEYESDPKRRDALLIEFGQAQGHALVALAKTISTWQVASNLQKAPQSVGNASGTAVSTTGGNLPVVSSSFAHIPISPVAVGATGEVFTEELLRLGGDEPNSIDNALQEPMQMAANDKPSGGDGSGSPPSSERAGSVGAHDLPANLESPEVVGLWILRGGDPKQWAAATGRHASVAESWAAQRADTFARPHVHVGADAAKRLAAQIGHGIDAGETRVWIADLEAAIDGEQQHSASCVAAAVTRIIQDPSEIEDVARELGESRETVQAWVDADIEAGTPRREPGTRLAVTKRNEALEAILALPRASDERTETIDRYVRELRSTRIAVRLNIKRYGETLMRFAVFEGWTRQELEEAFPIPVREDDFEFWKRFQDRLRQEGDKPDSRVMSAVGYGATVKKIEEIRRRKGLSFARDDSDTSVAKNSDTPQTAGRRSYASRIVAWAEQHDMVADILSVPYGERDKKITECTERYGKTESACRLALSRFFGVAIELIIFEGWEREDIERVFKISIPEGDIRRAKKRREGLLRKEGDNPVRRAQRALNFGATPTDFMCERATKPHGQYPIGTVGGILASARLRSIERMLEVPKGERKSVAESSARANNVDVSFVYEWFNRFATNAVRFARYEDWTEVELSKAHGFDVPAADFNTWNGQPGRIRTTEREGDDVYLREIVARDFHADFIAMRRIREGRSEDPATAKAVSDEDTTAEPARPDAASRGPIAPSPPHPNRVLAAVADASPIRNISALSPDARNAILREILSTPYGEREFVNERLAQKHRVLGRSLGPMVGKFRELVVELCVLEAWTADNINWVFGTSLAQSEVEAWIATFGERMRSKTNSAYRSRRYERAISNGASAERISAVRRRHAATRPWPATREAGVTARKAFLLVLEAERRGERGALKRAVEKIVETLDLKESKITSLTRAYRVLIRRILQYPEWTVADINHAFRFDLTQAEIDAWPMDSVARHQMPDTAVSGYLESLLEHAIVEYGASADAIAEIQARLFPSVDSSPPS